MQTFFCNKTIDLNQAISLLGVSSTTIKNWVKRQYIFPISDIKGKLAFDCVQINNLKDKIVSGEINRLNKRANKKHSNNTFIPDEYAGNQEVIDLVQNIITERNANYFNDDSVILAFALRLFKKRRQNLSNK